ncbi:TetR/AcrR family transcriptional regulator [Conexibacter sp. SYSU D00693]|uniref:TetR/AcrR family transcriptional regulator n=1 Tax=Conexibacter sp. SYSU D00693 TaxID=2812560 RepID=UPI00196B16B1|nr:TetR/AcrR family transcriptional regulator [Conexibacter sp. SYSU D00693]
MKELEPSSGRARRSDALRNIDAILQAASLLLADQPRASMQDIAEAAGVHRATVHRHFPSRDDLLMALRRRSLDDTIALLRDRELTDGEPGAAVERLSAAVLRIGETNPSWRMTPVHDEISEERDVEMREPLVALMTRGRESGALRGDLPPLLLAAAWGGLIVGMLPLIRRRVLSPEQAGAVVRRMLSTP